MHDVVNMIEEENLFEQKEGNLSIIVNDSHRSVLEGFRPTCT